jgi:hypothetical protein
MLSSTIKGTTLSVHSQFVFDPQRTFASNYSISIPILSDVYGRRFEAPLEVYKVHAQFSRLHLT